MPTTFADQIAPERTRLNGLLDDIAAQITTLETKAVGHQRELAALGAYEAALTGKAVTLPKDRSARRGARSETLLAMISGTAGMTRAQILDATGTKGDKAQEGAISNALTNMKKKGTLALEGGVYTAL